MSDPIDPSSTDDHEPSTPREEREHGPDAESEERKGSQEKEKRVPGPGAPVKPEPASPDANPIDPRVF